MSGNPWYKRYPKDFFDGTTRLTFEQKGAYTLCLDLMYKEGGPIPDDPKWISRQLGCSMQLWRKLRQALIDHGKLTLTDDERLANGRATYEMHLSRSVTGSQSEKGKRGGRPRKVAQPKVEPARNIELSAAESANINGIGLTGEKPDYDSPETPKEQQNPQESPNKVPTNLRLFEEEPSNINILSFTDGKPLRDSERKSPPTLVKSPIPRACARDVEEAILEAWKQTGLPEPRKMTPERRRRLADRVKEHGLDGVLEAVAAIGASRFCHGDGAREGWKATIDFLLQEKSCLGALEGRYADRKKSAAKDDPHAGWFGP